MATSAGGNVHEAEPLNDAGSSFDALKHRCATLGISMEPSIDEQLAAIVRRKDASKSRKRQLEHALRQRILYTLTQHETSAKQVCVPALHIPCVQSTDHPPRALQGAA